MLLRLTWCDLGVGRCQLNTRWYCYCRWWGMCWQQFDWGFDAEDCSRYRRWGLVKILKLKFSWDVEVEVWSRFSNWSLVKMLRLKFGPDFLAKDWSTFWARSLGEIWKLKLGRASKAHLWHDLKEFILVKACNPWVCCAFGNVST